MELNEAIVGRRAVREYTNLPVDQATILRLIDAAVRAPSAVNQQPYFFTVVRDQDVLDRISRGAKAFMLARLEDSPYAEHFRMRLSEPNFQIFYHAPVLVLISANEQAPWIVEDCALAAENLMLAAYAAGLGTCWIGFAQGFLDTPDGKAMLNLPAQSVPVAPIIVGHPRSPVPKVPRKAPHVRWVG
jgi:nitroreductase